MRTNNRKGFTLAELLIVIAILGVLVAVAIPVFTSSLEEAKRAVDEANFRSAQAVASSLTLLGELNVEGAGKITKDDFLAGPAFTRGKALFLCEDGSFALAEWNSPPDNVYKALTTDISNDGRLKGSPLGIRYSDNKFFVAWAL